MNDDQQALIASLEAQERTLVFTRFDNADAWRLGSAMVAAAIERNLPVTIDIRRHGQQLFHVALPGTTAENDSWIERKVNVVNRFAAASYLVGQAARGARDNAGRGTGRRTTVVRGARRCLSDPRQGRGRRRHGHRIRPASGRRPCLCHRDDRRLSRHLKTLTSVAISVIMSIPERAAAGRPPQEAARRRVFQDLPTDVCRRGLGLRDEMPDGQCGLCEVAVHGARGIRAGEPVPGA